MDDVVDALCLCLKKVKMGSNGQKTMRSKKQSHSNFVCVYGLAMEVSEESASQFQRRGGTFQFKDACVTQ